MGYLNKVMLIGRLGQEPEIKVTPGGHFVMSLSLATTEKFTDKQGNKQERTEWHKVVLWNNIAEVVEKFCKKGSQLYVEGQLQTREWQDKDGNKRYTTEIQGRQIQLLDKSNNSRRRDDGGYGDPPPYHSGSSDEFIEDDIPF